VSTLEKWRLNFLQRCYQTQIFRKRSPRKIFGMVLYWCIGLSTKETLNAVSSGVMVGCQVYVVFIKLAKLRKCPKWIKTRVDGTKRVSTSRVRPS
jgi:hypothetical protein